MKDTPPAVEKLYRQLLMQRSGAERLRMGCEMFDGARKLVRASLGDPAAQRRDPELRSRLFLRTYGNDFDPQTAVRIAAALRLLHPIERGVGPSPRRKPGSSASGKPKCRRSSPGSRLSPG